MPEILPYIVDFIENIWNFGVALKQPENCIYSKIFFWKVVSLKNIYMKESHWLYFLQIYTVSFYNFFLWPTVSVQRHLTNTYQLARDMFIFMDSAIICIHFINIQLPISSKITAVFLIIRNTVVITLTHIHTLLLYITIATTTSSSGNSNI